MLNSPELVDVELSLALPIKQVKFWEFKLQTEVLQEEINIEG